MKIRSILPICKELLIRLIMWPLRIEVKIYAKDPYWDAKAYTYLVVFNYFRMETEFESVPMVDGIISHEYIKKVAAYASEVKVFYGFNPYGNGNDGTQ